MLTFSCENRFSLFESKKSFSYHSINDFAPSLALKQRLEVIRIWAIGLGKKIRCHQNNTNLKENCNLINRIIMRIFSSCTWCSVCDSCL